MRKVAIGLISATVIVWSVVAVILAAPASKVWVCKYVGKPGVDERLQTGNNPISVSSNAIKDYKGVGSYFNDAHGRSYVLAVDNGQPEPDVSNCPAPQTPVNPPSPSPTPTPTPNPTSTPQTTSTSSSSNTVNDTEATVNAGK